MQQKNKDALKYHSEGRSGKTEIIPTKPVRTPEELALAYSPGAVFAAEGISHNRWNAYKYTNKGNLVGIIGNGSNISDTKAKGAMAAKPLLEGRSMLFKIYADIDAFDIEIAEENSDRLIEIIHSMAPTFGAIDLSSIEAPQCYYIERKLRGLLDIPIINDNRCGKAVCCAAAIMNAMEFACKKSEEIKVLLNSNESAITEMLLQIGIKQENITILENKKESLLSNAIKNRDIFIAVSKENIITGNDLSAMSHDPIVILLSDVSIDTEPDKAKGIRSDAIIVTCNENTRNTINDVIAFPYIFRAALDTYATSINDTMLFAAAKAIAQLAQRPVPASLQKMYKGEHRYSREYLLPLPNDRRLATEVSVAVAKAAMNSGIARNPIVNWDEYCNTLLSRLEREYRFYREIFYHHRSSPKLRRRYNRTMPSITL